MNGRFATDFDTQRRSRDARFRQSTSDLRRAEIGSGSPKDRDSNAIGDDGHAIVRAKARQWLARRVENRDAHRTIRGALFHVEP